MTGRLTTLALLAVVSLAHPAVAAEVDGAKIHWTSKGSGNPTVIFVHGWTCDDTSWNAQVPIISQSRRVITLDLPGHGRSGSPSSGTFSMELFARAVEAVRNEAKVDRAVLVGHSMGTPVIRQYALMYPQRVSALVLVDGLVQVPTAGGGGRRVPAPMTGAAGVKARETIIRGMFSASTPLPVQQQILKMMLGAPEATANGAMAATWDSTQWKTDPITVPVLGIYADRSGLANRDGMKQIYPTAEYHEIPGTGHFLMMEKPDEFNRLLSEFLGRLK
jgi:pimeloyl-ACP methyl ester carboxylesterase